VSTWKGDDSLNACGWIEDKVWLFEHDDRQCWRHCRTARDTTAADGVRRDPRLYNCSLWILVGSSSMPWWTILVPRGMTLFSPPIEGQQRADLGSVWESRPLCCIPPGVPSGDGF
jgi:hypothetical protein